MPPVAEIINYPPNREVQLTHGYWHLAGFHESSRPLLFQSFPLCLKIWMTLVVSTELERKRQISRSWRILVCKRNTDNLSKTKIGSPCYPTFLDTKFTHNCAIILLLAEFGPIQIDAEISRHSNGLADSSSTHHHFFAADSQVQARIWHICLLRTESYARNNWSRIGILLLDLISLRSIFPLVLGHWKWAKSQQHLVTGTCRRINCTDFLILEFSWSQGLIRGIRVLLGTTTSDLLKS